MRGEGPKVVGLFANQPADFIDSVAELCGLDYAQLCGDEPPDFWNGLSVPVIRQVKVRDDLDKPDAVALAVRHVEMALDAGHLALLDKHVAGLSGRHRFFVRLGGSPRESRGTTKYSSPVVSTLKTSPMP